MRLNRRLLILIFGMTLLASPAAADELTDGARNFVQSLADKAISSLVETELSTAEREKRFRDLFHEYFDVQAIGRWVLGRYWRQATDEERAAFLREFEDFVVKTYANRFQAYSNERFKIVDTSRQDGTALVYSEIVRESSGAPIRIEWRVAAAERGYLITDIVVEGVSMAQTQRSEFSSVIRRSGGSVGGLIAALKNKNKTLSTTN